MYQMGGTESREWIDDMYEYLQYRHWYCHMGTLDYDMQAHTCGAYIIRDTFTIGSGIRFRQI